MIASTDPQLQNVHILSEETCPDSITMTRDPAKVLPLLLGPNPPLAVWLRLPKQRGLFTRTKGPGNVFYHMEDGKPVIDEENPPANYSTGHWCGRKPLYFAMPKLVTLAGQLAGTMPLQKARITAKYERENTTDTHTDGFADIIGTMTLAVGSSLLVDTSAMTEAEAQEKLELKYIHVIARDNIAPVYSPPLGDAIFWRGNNFPKKKKLRPVWHASWPVQNYEDILRPLALFDFTLTPAARRAAPLVFES
ncbi:MAG: hypothetical protein AB7G06_08415 [Bdellovibrionales bacterium]